jgi:hypothetical protein
MTTKINKELSQAMQQANPATEIPVIVTLNGSINQAELAAQGLQISQVFELISAVSGTVRPAGITALAQLEQVKLIEFDGEVRIATP